MNERIFTPLIGAIIGLVSFETLQNLVYSLIIAFLGGIAAWAGKKLCQMFEKRFFKKEDQIHED